MRQQRSVSRSYLGEAELDDVLKLPATMDVARARALFDDLMPAAARLS
jgi:hypothetical protein